MKKITTLLLTFLLLSTNVEARDIILKNIEFSKLGTERIARDISDRTYSALICSPDGLKEFIKNYNLQASYSYPKKENSIVIAVLNNSITEAITAVIKNETSNKWFVDTADSGIEYKLRAPPKNKQYTSVSLITIKGECNIPHVGLRRPTKNGLSNRYK